MKASRLINAFRIAAIALTLLTACSKQEERVVQPTPVTVWTVANLAGENGLRYSANIKPDVQVDLAFKASGYVEEILQVTGVDGRRRNVQEGDFIKKGTVLARVRATEYRDRVAEAQAGLTKAKSDFDRAAKLFENQSIAKADYDAAYAGYTSAQARYDQAAQALRDCALQAPMDGFVLKRNVEVGTLAGLGMPGFILADTRAVKAVFGVPDMIVGQMKMGDYQTVTTEAIPGVGFRGRITRIAPSADPNSRVFEVECTIPNPDNRLKAGMIAALKIAAQASSPSAMLLPLNAIVRPRHDPKGYAVFVVEESNGKPTARERKINLGDVVGNSISVTAGLQGGEKVIVRGATLVVDSQEVRIIP
ncbi:efflux RND transporter periplasmic adaptor subunit [candidate division KSB1 bacterium]|nr:efflux RND transporter periplasmic adaptor subunit [candidate division KSB1 bacterium]